MNKSQSRPVVVMILIFIFFTFSAHAATLTSSVVINSGILGNSESPQSGASGPLIDSLGLGAGTTSASATSSVDYGNIKSFASASQVWPSNGDAYGNLYVKSAGYWEDTVTIDSPYLSYGESGSFTFSAVFSGSGFATTPPTETDLAYSQYYLQLQVSDTYFYKNGAYLTSGFVGDGFGLITGTVSFVNNEPFSLWGNLVVEANVLPYFQSDPGDYEALMDASNTFTWLGIDQVMDSAGNDVAYTLSSESGVNWSVSANVVPIPSAVWLLGSGFIGVIGIRKKFRKVQ